MLSAKSFLYILTGSTRTVLTAASTIIYIKLLWDSVLLVAWVHVLNYLPYNEAGYTSIKQSREK